MAVYQSLLHVSGSPCVAEFKGHIKQALEKSKAAAAEGVLPALIVHRNRKSLGTMWLCNQCVLCRNIRTSHSPRLTAGPAPNIHSE